MSTSRRNFIRKSAIAGVAVYSGLNLAGWKEEPIRDPQNDLYALSERLLQEWADALIRLQEKGDNTVFGKGALRCPACGKIHGRIGDAIYPLLFLADRKNDQKYADSAVLLYRWMEDHVSQPDGSWLNEPIPGEWKGITVFGTVALSEALKNHGHVLNKKDREEMTERLKRAGNFISSNFVKGYGNINYFVSASYAMALLGELFDDPGFKSKGRYYAHESLRFFTSKNRFLYGEGKPFDVASPKGCFAIDLGYNVEESLPALVLYCLLTEDQEVLDTCRESLNTHMEFMLPDGGWDNSWGTRNFKWTYWGSRTSDGCQPAYALLSHLDPRYHKVALKNTQLLNACTHDGLLYGGPHYYSHGIAPCVHHTFCHSKALATILDHQDERRHIDLQNVRLPRETSYGIRSFEDIQTWLISKGKFRATITGYDREYQMKGGHATGGALSMLWHELTGPVFSASMNRYQLVEKHNMQPDQDPDSMSLTPRVELVSQSTEYKNVNDLKARITCYEEGTDQIVEVNSKLVDENQQSPATGDISCHLICRFSDNKVTMSFNCGDLRQDNNLRIIIPVISRQDEVVRTISEKNMLIEKGNCTLKISSDQDMQLIPVSGKRIFNHVPGLEAIPLSMDGPQATIVIEVT